MNTNQILSRPKIQRGKRRARRKKITPTITKKQNNAIPPQNQTTVVFTQDSVSNNNKKYKPPKNSRQMQAQNIAAMAAARVNRLNSATSRPKSLLRFGKKANKKPSTPIMQGRKQPIQRPKALSVGTKSRLTKKASSKGFQRVHYSDAPTTPKLLRSVKEKTKDQKANLTSDENALWVSGDVRWLQVKDDDKNDIFVPAKFVSKSKKKLETNKLIFQQIPSPWLPPEKDVNCGKEWTVEEDHIGPRIEDIEHLNKTVENMVQLDEVHPATVLHNLMVRFVDHNEFMTRVGPILVVINPFKFYPEKYGTNIVDKYHNNDPDGMQSPHVYQIAEQAIRQLMKENTSQAILISGESGAGKTETTKKCLQYFAEVAGSESGAEISDRILSANPILEALGNSKTLRNDNSSRFGKYMQVHFKRTHKLEICGCSTTSYLLEKSRITNIGTGERSYHIFYQLLAGADDGLKRKLQLTGLDHYDNFNYLKNGDLGNDMVYTSDSDHFHFTKEGLNRLGFRTSEQFDMFSVIAGILHLGNIDFIPGEQGVYASVENLDVVQKAATVLGLDADKLAHSMCVQTLYIAGDTTDKLLTPEKAQESRDALCKALYSKMFDWVMERINASMRKWGNNNNSNNNSDDDDNNNSNHNNNGTSNDDSNMSIIGILDIFGFELFDKNSLEQLCINFANEKLQQHFNKAIFKEEAKECELEGIHFASGDGFTDNQDVLDMFEKKPKGLLLLLDEEVRLPRGSDTGFLNKMFKAHAIGKKARLLERRKGHKTARNQFWIQHFADYVKYDIDGFLDKNRDELGKNLEDVVKTSTMKLINTQLFPVESDQKNDNKPVKRFGRRGGGGRNKRNKKSTQVGTFRVQLSSLMKALNRSQPHFIRCIKPNKLKDASMFDSGMINRQLACSGVHQAVLVRKQGYPYRLDFDYFINRYWPLLSTAKRRGFIKIHDSKSKVEAYLKELDNKCQGIATASQFGHSKIFIKEPHYAWLERYRDVVRDRASRKIERIVRGQHDRVLVTSVKSYKKLMRNAMDRGDLGKAQELLQTLKSRVEGHEVMLEEAYMLEQLLEQRRKDDIEKRNRKQQMSASNQSIVSNNGTNGKKDVVAATVDDVIVVEDTNDKGTTDDDDDDEQLSPEEDYEKSNDLQLLALRATRSLTENLEAMWNPMSSGSKIQKLKLLNLLVSGVLKSVSHEEIKGEQLTYEKAKEYLNGPLEKFAAKPLKTVSSGKKEMEDTSKLGKNLLQQHL